MATRATYMVDGMLFYAHHDGYPTGAAERFARMIGAWYVPTEDNRMEAAEHPAGGLAFAFIRGNLDVAPAVSEGDHSDAQFRYVVAQRPDGRVEITVRDREAKEPDRGELSEWMAHQQRNLRNDLAMYWTENPTEAPNEVTDGLRTAVQQAAMDAAEAIPLIVRIKREATIVYATLDNAARIKHRHAVVSSRCGSNPQLREIEQRHMREVFTAMHQAVTMGEALGLSAIQLDPIETT